MMSSTPGAARPLLERGFEPSPRPGGTAVVTTDSSRLSRADGGVLDTRSTTTTKRM
jgi:hypothetical protein